MKTFNFKSLLNLSLMAGLLVSTVLVSSCKSDDDDDEVTSGGSAPTADGKKLTSVSNGNSIAIFDYDAQGRVTTVTEGTTKTSFTYSDTQIIVTKTYSGSTSGSLVTYTLKDGRVVKQTEKSSDPTRPDYVYDYTYDGNGCLTKVSYSYTYTDESSYSSYSSNKTTYTNTETENYTWKDGNIESVQSESSYTRVYVYSYTSYNNNIPVTSSTTTTYTEKTTGTTRYSYSEHVATMPALGSSSVLNWQGYFGKNSTKLVSRAVETRTTTTSETSSGDNSNSNRPNTETSNETIDYVYTFNGSAIEKILVTSIEDGKQYFTTHELTWN